MFNINPINFNQNNYHLVKRNEKVKPVNKASNDRNNHSNSSDFKEVLEEELKKQKKKKLIKEE